ncbi:MAG: tRNA (adenosine(37)-N6)-threonylcarbamoyltransferase complex dimerization subunit type 1 TsaB [Bacteroidetes bacterium]|nr:MAG: tRNA (adenosine(37)-N6)-threonylcarbamoyltransferase complex dimerization subunit type 1 TsaB [Bacteroidota bacterium]
MAFILNIETATRVCSVALAIDGVVTSIRESHVANSHSELITLFAEEVMNEAGIPFSRLDAISVSMGPGSYTGLRIGVSTAKGLCYSLDKPLIAISTLKAMAAGMAGLVEDDQFLLCPMIDARRMEVYAAVYDLQLRELRPTEAVIVDDQSFGELLESHNILFAGDGAPKCKEVLSHQQHAVFHDEFHPSTRYMATLSEQKFRQNVFEDVAYFEPFYLKDFVAGIPKVKGLR